MRYIEMWGRGGQRHLVEWGSWAYFILYNIDIRSGEHIYNVWWLNNYVWFLSSVICLDQEINTLRKINDLIWINTRHRNLKIGMPFAMIWLLTFIQMLSNKFAWIKINQWI